MGLIKIRVSTQILENFLLNGCSDFYKGVIDLPKDVKIFDIKLTDYSNIIELYLETSTFDDEKEAYIVVERNGIWPTKLYLNYYNDRPPLPKIVLNKIDAVINRMNEYYENKEKEKLNKIKDPTFCGEFSDIL
jgi:hypothetical protein